MPVPIEATSRNNGAQATQVPDITCVSYKLTYKLGKPICKFDKLTYKYDI